MHHEWVRERKRYDSADERAKRAQTRSKAGRKPVMASPAV